jgi:kynurenine formamidase
MYVWKLVETRGSIVGTVKKKGKSVAGVRVEDSKDARQFRYHVADRRAAPLRDIFDRRLSPTARRVRAGSPREQDHAMRTILTIFAVAALGVFMTAQGRQPRVIDLGHAIQADDPTWDEAPAYQRSVVATIEKDGYAGGKITIEEHFGTHVDAPAHFAPGGWTVDRIPPDRLYRPGIRIDVSRQSSSNPDYRVTAADLQAFEKQSGRIPEGAVVLIATGWDRYWTDRARYMNEKNGVKHFPGLSAEATALLARDRRVAAIGIDTPSIDYGPSTGFEAHHVSMPLNVYHIENMTHLMDLPASGSQIIVAPINIGGGSGGPARVFALLR